MWHGDMFQTDNEENVLVCLRIIIELHKQYRPQISTEVSFLMLLNKYIVVHYILSYHSQSFHDSSLLNFLNFIICFTVYFLCFIDRVQCLWPSF